MGFLKNREKERRNYIITVISNLEEKILNIRKEFSPFVISIKISGLYFILGCLWILSSDKIVSALVKSKDVLILISMIKGWIYVFLSALLIFIVTFDYLKRIKKTETELLESYKELSNTHEELKKSKEKLQYLAYHDLLTNLPNKLSLLENFGDNNLLGKRSISALLFIDMDNFKYINDTMGHAFGDKLLVKVGDRLTYLAKGKSMIYRIGGDEFVLINQDIKGKRDAEVFASHITAGFEEKFEINDSILGVSLSIGIAIYPEDGDNIYDLLKCADIAMYKAKELGKSRYTTYTPEMKEVISERMELEKYLCSALEKDEFEIYYQPQFDLKEKRITGLEALLRWRSPEMGLISPLKFIKIAEDTHLIIPLGAWVLRNACSFLKRLEQKGYKDVTISVNISIFQLLQSDFVDIIKYTLEFFEIQPRYLELEITESILIESFDAINEKLRYLKNMGVRIALDDFGKGYSSLSYLKQLPISTLKIDKSFIDGIIGQDENKTLTGHIIRIGNSMDMCVIAEGVEDKEQLEYLERLGCHKIQGYLFSKPIPEKELMELLKKDSYL